MAISAFEQVYTILKLTYGVGERSFANYTGAFTALILRMDVGVRQTIKPQA